MIDWARLRATLLPETSRRLVPANIKLPILPIAVTKFSKRADDPNVEIRELGKIIETDSGLTTELLKHVNSSALGLRKKASTAQQAISALGIRGSKLLILTTAVKRSMKGTESKLINIQNFWITNLERSIFARLVAKLLKTDVELAFAAAMLQDFLLPLLANELEKPYVEFAHRQLSRPQHLVDYELQQFHWTHAEAAAQVMKEWGFPDDLVCCVALHHKGLEVLADPILGRTPAAAVAVSAMIPCSLRQVPDGIERLIRLEQAWPAFQLDLLSQQVQAEFRQMSPGPENPYSFRRIVEKTLAAMA